MRSSSRAGKERKTREETTEVSVGKVGESWWVPLLGVSGVADHIGIVGLG